MGIERLGFATMPMTAYRKTDKHDRGPQRPGLRSEIDPARFSAFYAPKWGKNGAALLFRQKYWIRVTTAICAWGCLLVLAGVVPVASLVVVGALAAPPAFKATQYAKRVSVAASDALKVEVGFGGVAGPPRRHSRYLRWCERRGLTPYQAQKAQ